MLNEGNTWFIPRYRNRLCLSYIFENVWICYNKKATIIPFTQLLEIQHIRNLRLACDPAIVKNSDSFRKSQSNPFSAIQSLPRKPIIAMDSRSCPEEMENCAKNLSKWCRNCLQFGEAHARNSVTYRDDSRE